jgi:hypothetical protein
MISSPGCLCLMNGAFPADVDAVLDHLASGSAEIVPLEICASDPRYLLLDGHDLLLSPSGS